MVVDFSERNPMDILCDLKDRATPTWEEQELLGFDLSYVPKKIKPKPLSKCQKRARAFDRLFELGLSNKEVMVWLRVSRQTVWVHRKRFEEGRK